MTSTPPTSRPLLVRRPRSMGDRRGSARRPSSSEPCTTPVPPVPTDGYGLDRLSFSFPVKDYAEPSRWDRATHSYVDGQVTLVKRVVSDRPEHKGASVMVGFQTVQ